MPLHDLISGLDGAQDLYARGRPPYPPAAVDALTAGCAVEPGARVLDLGAGTGLLARPLLDAGYDVVAVEPLEGMRAALAPSIGAQRVRDGTAEAIPLEDASVDAVVCGDSYHWFDADRAPAEIHRVLRPGGGLGLVWRWADATDDAPWVEPLAKLLARGAARPSGVHARTAAPTGSPATAASSRSGVSASTFTHTTDVAGVRDYVASITFVALLAPERRAALLDAVAAPVRATSRSRSRCRCSPTSG